MMSVALVYSAEIRNNGTPILCLDATKRGLGFGENVRRYTPLGEVPEHELYVYIDDGRDGLEWECPHPCVYWAVDTHLGYDWRLHKAKQFDWVYCAQKEGAERMRADGVEKVEWLPLACHPTAHPNLQELMVHPERERLAALGLDKCWDVVFVGFMNTGMGLGTNDRVEYLDALFKAVPNFWCSVSCFFEEMALRYVRGRVGANLSIKQDLNMRFFEVLSTGTCLLTNRDVVGWKELGFVEGEDFVGYQGIEEMIEKTKWCLHHPEEREVIAKRGHEKVRASHTYVHRMSRIFEAAGVKIPNVPGTV